MLDLAEGLLHKMQRVLLPRYVPAPPALATEPVLSRRLEAGRSALRRLPHLSTYDRRERAISTLVTPLALHGVVVASVTGPDLRGLETAVLRACGGARTCPGPRRLSSRSDPMVTASPR